MSTERFEVSVSLDVHVRLGTNFGLNLGINEINRGTNLEVSLGINFGVNSGPSPGLNLNSNPSLSLNPSQNSGWREGKASTKRSRPRTRQIFYIFILSGIGGMIVSGGINFGLAYVENPIFLFQLPNTLAGDGAVTIIIQCIITWFVEKGLVALDLSRRGIQPIGFIPMPTHPWLRWLFFLPQLGYDKAAEAEALYEPQGKTPASGFAGAIVSVMQEATRGFLAAVASFFLLWPASVGILIVFGEDVGGDFTYSDRWIPQIFKGILGGVLGLLTTPLMAGFWLIKAGWEGDRNPYLEG
ncbi:hypothetical protein B0J13DRAFT_623698 [Dactylonectria estremocensis]|uniref:Uncharacterized protein n=1 Tax=Dactylonectria estremocensis TaxID=1079267 RepID=A0A9P9EPB4_9HYPO|nr:hypothetical protein B0J13DRAFT_623698 [Dactylonectria estremocensis]